MRATLLSVQCIGSYYRITGGQPCSQYNVLLHEGNLALSTMYRKLLQEGNLAMYRKLLQEGNLALSTMCYNRRATLLSVQCAITGGQPCSQYNVLLQEGNLALSTMYRNVLLLRMCEIVLPNKEQSWSIRTARKVLSTACCL